ncbi:MAG: hypothetical protein GF320_16090 [Armatimonadia bacterium]|jgi:hypothetical protein|nr:hypothetical protein [Armatimonadia bacterium]
MAAATERDYQRALMEVQRLNGEVSSLREQLSLWKGRAASASEGLLALQEEMEVIRRCKRR